MHFFLFMCIIHIGRCWLVVTERIVNCNVAYCFSMEIVWYFFFFTYEELYLLGPFQNIKQLVLIFTVSNSCC